MKLKTILIKNSYLSLIVFICLITVSSCDNNEEIDLNNKKLSIIEKENNLLTKNSLKIGAKSIKVTENEIIIKSEAVKVNGETYIVPNFKFGKSENHFEIILNKEKKLLFDRNTHNVKIIFDGISTNLFDLDDRNFSNEDIRDISIMLTIAEDMFIEDLPRKKSVTLLNKCGGWTYINVGVGRNSADARLTNEVNEVLKENKNCKRLTNENDTSCVWENSACIATTEIECEC